jgi:hypothetical protein
LWSKIPGALGMLSRMEIVHRDLVAFQQKSQHEAFAKLKFLREKADQWEREYNHLRRAMYLILSGLAALDSLTMQDSKYLNLRDFLFPLGLENDKSACVGGMGQAHVVNLRLTIEQIHLMASIPLPNLEKFSTLFEQWLDVAGKISNMAEKIDYLEKDIAFDCGNREQSTDAIRICNRWVYWAKALRSAVEVSTNLHPDERIKMTRIFGQVELPMENRWFNSLQIVGLSTIEDEPTADEVSTLWSSQSDS